MLNGVFIFCCLVFLCKGFQLSRHSRTSELKLSLSRKDFIVPICVCFMPLLFQAQCVIAADTGLTAALFKSGKNPYPPNPNDSKAGTKKDSKFLRCISNCKSKCELPSEGLAIERSDCIQDCQDQCCESYEQCSYKIKIGSQGM